VSVRPAVNRVRATVLQLRTVAASVALPGLDDSESVLTVTASVAKGGVLEYLPAPMVVADEARHTTVIEVDLAASAALVLRDEIILGRHGERGGACRTRLCVDYDGRPLLRHDVCSSRRSPRTAWSCAVCSPA